ncbi:MAG: heme ABC exporter ATP-binding protein CcmA [Anaerolineae bacterium]|nr:heme ABC exporter ATP-binding protein CcmA [Anaerolineae bacterium]
MPLIETEDLTKSFGYVPVIKRLTLKIERGECVALLGANGSGKSTLLRMLSSLSKATGGVIRIGGWELPREATSIRAQIGMVAHKPLLYENLTAAENLQFFGRLYHLDPVKNKIRADILLEQVGLARRANDLVRTFSRGMQQRLSIVRALLHDPDILLLDEPHTGLDQRGVMLLNELIMAARAEGRTILMATHEFNHAALLATRILILERGSMILDRPAADLDSAQLAAIFAEQVSA